MICKKEKCWQHYDAEILRSYKLFRSKRFGPASGRSEIKMDNNDESNIQLLYTKCTKYLKELAGSLTRCSCYPSKKLIREIIVMQKKKTNLRKRSIAESIALSYDERI